MGMHLHGSPLGGMAPLNTAPPAIYGVPKVGQILTASTGSWTNSPTSYAYQWQREGSNISGAMASTYTPVAADLSGVITVAVVATNGAGASAPAIGFLANLIKIMPLGDSLTAGFNSPGGYRDPLWTNLRNDGYNIAYVGSVAGTGTLPFESNEGHGGYTISTLSGTAPGTIKDGIDTSNWLSVNPDIILLLVGINDFFGGRTTAQANADYSALLDDILGKLPSVKIICASLVQFNTWVDTFNANLVTLVGTKGSRVSFVDTHAALSPSDLLGDNTHPNQGGYNKMAPVWEAGVKAIAPLATGPVISTTAFYVSQSTGLDANAGTQAAPWKTIAKVNAQSFAPGTSVLFKRGDTWRIGDPAGLDVQISPAVSGTAGNRIVFDAYGIGANPIFQASTDASLTGNWTNIGTNLWQSVQTFPPKALFSVTMTIASPCVVTWSTQTPLNGHPVIFATTGTLPAGITAGTTYYAINQSGTTLQLALTPGGAAINTSGSQSGAHTAGTNGIQFNDANDIGNIVWGLAPLGGTAPAAVMSGTAGTMIGTGPGGVWFLPGSAQAGLTAQGQWNFNTDNWRVQVFSVGNPATAMPGIQLVQDKSIVNTGKNFLTFQNLTMQLAAGNMFNLGSTDITIRDMVIQWIGGGNLSGSSVGGGSNTSRYGDGLDNGNVFSNYLVERNYWYQSYDGFYTPQSITGSTSNVVLRNNIFSRWGASFMGFIVPPPSAMTLDGVKIYNNTADNALAWSQNQRPNGNAQFGFTFSTNTSLSVTNFAMQNNSWSGQGTSCNILGYAGSGASFTLSDFVTPTIDYNLWRRADGTQCGFCGSTDGNETLAVWAPGTAAGFTHTPWEVHGLIDVAPSYVNSVNDLTPTAVSLLRNAGANLFNAGVVWDFNKKPRPTSGSFTIGAFQ